MIERDDTVVEVRNINIRDINLTLEANLTLKLLYGMYRPYG